MTRAPYTLTGDIGTAGTLGLIVLQADETLEQEFRTLFPDPATALYVTRIPSGADLTPDTIARMEADLPAAARLLPQPPRFDAVAYACTSGTTLIGADRVTALVRENCRTGAVCNPLDAAVAGFRALGIRSIGLVTPYVANVAAPMVAAFAARGIKVTAQVSFGERVEANVARIDPASIRAAALSLADAPGVQALFLSCTNLRTLGLIDDLETALSRPVLSSNQALAWQMTRHIPPVARPAGPGRLMRT